MGNCRRWGGDLDADKGGCIGTRDEVSDPVEDFGLGLEQPSQGGNECKEIVGGGPSLELSGGASNADGLEKEVARGVNSGAGTSTGLKGNGLRGGVDCTDLEGDGLGSVIGGEASEGDGFKDVEAQKKKDVDGVGLGSMEIRKGLSAKGWAGGLGEDGKNIPEDGGRSTTQKFVGQGKQGSKSGGGHNQGRTSKAKHRATPSVEEESGKLVKNKAGFRMVVSDEGCLDRSEKRGTRTNVRAMKRMARMNMGRMLAVRTGKKKGGGNSRSVVGLEEEEAHDRVLLGKVSNKRKSKSKSCSVSTSVDDSVSIKRVGDQIGVQ